jgi:hypothetical protein
MAQLVKGGIPMAHPTDHGFAVIKAGRGGTHNIAICADVVDGAPVRAYAAYYNASITFDPAISLKKTSAGHHTTEIVEVSQDEAGGVWIRRPRSIQAP